VTDFDALSKLVLASKDEAEDAFNKFFEMFSSYMKK
jgi:hypothetical protein